MKAVVSNVDCTLEPLEKLFKKYPDSGLIPDQFNQNVWWWKPGVSMLLQLPSFF